uniref:Tc1-like transposase DDE domain-containing protein n=1 Tax=Oryzias latipes TaxID=8090 RepID=A0A3B3IJX5_ORYLA
MHDNAPSQAASKTSASLAAMGIKGDKLMMWPPSFSDLNPIQNFWSILNGVALCSASWNNNSRCYILCVFLHLLLTLSECGLLPVCFILCSFKCVNVCQRASCSC